MQSKNTALLITVEGDEYGPQAVYLGYSLIGYRRGTGYESEIYQEVTDALAELVREKLGYSKEEPSVDE